MIKAFNAFQAIAAFAIAPFGISWLSEATFKGAGIAFWVAILIYIVAFMLNVVAVTVAMEKFD